MDEYKETAGLLRALSHPVRLQIIEVLARDGDACVCHLESMLGQRQAQVSQHLMRLRGAGLVTARREGMNIFYSLVDRDVLAILQVSLKTAEKLPGRHGRTAPEARVRQPCPCPRCNPVPSLAIA